MMSLRTVLIGTFAIVFGLAAALGVFLIARPEAPGLEMVSVIVAKENIARGQSLSADLLGERAWPKDALPEGAVVDMEAALERTVLIPVAKGELILEVKLASKGSGRGMAAIVPPGMRAVTIQTPNISTGVAGFILPGNKVDVLLTVASQAANDPSGGATTFTLLQNVEILAVDQRIDAPQDNKMDPKELRSVTLMVTPTDAARLDLGQNRGTLHLALRNPGDEATLAVEPATLFGLNGAPPLRVEISPTANDDAVVVQPPPPVTVWRVRTLRGLQSGRIDMQPPPAEVGAPATGELPAAQRLSNRPTPN